MLICKHCHEPMNECMCVDIAAAFKIIEKEQGIISLDDEFVCVICGEILCDCATESNEDWMSSWNGDVN